MCWVRVGVCGCGWGGAVKLQLVCMMSGTRPAVLCLLGRAEHGQQWERATRTIHTHIHTHTCTPSHAVATPLQRVLLPTKDDPRLVPTPTHSYLHSRPPAHPHLHPHPLRSCLPTKMTHTCTHPHLHPLPRPPHNYTAHLSQEELFADEDDDEDLDDEELDALEEQLAGAALG